MSNRELKNLTNDYGGIKVTDKQDICDCRRPQTRRANVPDLCDQCKKQTYYHALYRGNNTTESDQVSAANADETQHLYEDIESLLEEDGELSLAEEFSVLGLSNDACDQGDRSAFHHRNRSRSLDLTLDRGDNELYRPPALENLNRVRDAILDDVRGYREDIARVQLRNQIIDRELQRLEDPKREQRNGDIERIEEEGDEFEEGFQLFRNWTMGGENRFRDVKMKNPTFRAQKAKIIGNFWQSTKSG